jgi:ADP-ribose pyrophosphatase YjhB (NUDIX family)
MPPDPEDTRTLPDPYRYCPFCASELTPFHDETVDRQRCENCGWVHYRNPTAGVAVILLSDQGLLLGRRRGGGWCIPCGHVEWDESVEEAAQREAREETNLDVALSGLYAVHSNFHDRKQHTVGHWYLAQADDFSDARPGGDLVELGFFALDDLPSLIFPTDRLVARRLQEEVWGNPTVPSDPTGNTS